MVEQVSFYIQTQAACTYIHCEMGPGMDQKIELSAFSIPFVLNFQSMELRNSFLLQLALMV
jgi:hypothetical protein